jgi:RimJ/RimL family protein N-acetyltransferase
VVKNKLPDQENTSKQYCAPYIVHLRDNENDITTESKVNSQTLDAVIGLVGIHTCRTYGIPFPDHLTLSKALREPTGASLVMELGYQFLPTAWNKGYCTEAVRAITKGYSGATEYWKPYQRVFLHVVVGEDNLASLSVLEKVGIPKLGVHEWDGDPIFLAGAYRDCRVVVFGSYLPVENSSSY